MENFSKWIIMKNNQIEITRENRNRISEMIKSQDEFIITQDTHEERGNDLKNISTEMIQTETGRGKKK